MKTRVTPCGCAAVLMFAVSACGGGGSSGGAPPPVVTPSPPVVPAVQLQRAFANLTFTQPVGLKQAPGDPARWYVVEQAGRVMAFDNDPAAAAATVFLDITGRVNDNASEAGLLGMAFHPGYPSTPDVYFSYTGSGAGGALTSVVSRFVLDGTGLALDPASEVVLLQFAQPQGNHNGGDLMFGPDGDLYVAFGDGGGTGDPGENAQNTTNLFGTVLRINVDGAAPYEVPTDNPFAGGALCNQGSGAADCPEIYAWGLRNPWRMSFDRLGGSLWVGDVGQGDWEEVNRLRLGGNYGWNDREGAHCFDPPVNCATGFDEPVTEYDHAVGRSVTGGYVYRGTALTELAGWYLFGDFITGVLLAVEVNAQPTTPPEHVGDAGFNISAFAEDTNGELLVLNYGAGSIHQVVAP